MAKFLTWNINGLNSPQKRKKVFHYLRQFKNDIICLQETHIALKDQKFLFNSKLGLHFIASAPKKKGGVVVYVKQELSPKLIESDQEGRFIIIEIMMDGKKCLVVGLYAPNQQSEQKQFYKHIHQKLVQLDYRSVILLGDWNGVIDPTKDKGLTKIVNNVKLPKTFFDLKEDLELRDIWRDRHMEEKDFTFFSDRHQSYSRIDFILITNDLFSRVKNTKIFPRIISDHSPVWMELFKEEKNTRSWRLNENLFRYEENVNKCKEQLK